MNWMISHRADPQAAVIADRHYSRQSIGSTQFVPPGRCFVLWMPSAYWVTSWPFARYVKHEWAGAWMCSAFRHEENTIKASELIIQAVAATRWYYGNAPELGMVTFIDREKVRPTMCRGKKTWGYCYKKAGFVEVGETKGGLLALQLTPEKMPEPEPPMGVTYGMFSSHAEMLMVGSGPEMSQP